MKDSPYVQNAQKKGEKVTRVAEIQLIEKGANPSIDEVSRQVEEALRPNKNTNVDRVRVYSEGELLVEFVRTPEGFSKKVFP